MKISINNLLHDVNSNQYWAFIGVVTYVIVFITLVFSVFYVDVGRELGRKEAYQDAIDSGVATEVFDEYTGETRIVWE